DDNVAGFYLISKTEDGSVISGPEATSRITNEYNDLWAEIRRCRNLIKSTQGKPVPSPKLPLLGNVMRRIIESYFLDIGEKGTITSLGLSTNKKVAILLAFCNSTSHSAIGSEIYEVSSWKPMQLLNAFEEVFSTIDDGAHRGHYDMMMRARPGDPTFS
ncbi:MAG: AAA family ATPase, partial [Actinomyces sp.]|nr:AAA family ATPase [Actinomyces sp.]